MSKSPPREKSGLLRKASQAKMPLKEKIVQIYEAFFRGEDPSIGNPNFWDELFLLKVNHAYMEGEFEKLSGEQLVSLKDTINTLFYRSVITLQETTDPQGDATQGEGGQGGQGGGGGGEGGVRAIRLQNAMATLCALIRGVSRRTGAGDFGFDVIDLLVGFDSAENMMQILVERLTQFISGDFPPGVKSLAIRVLMVLVTATDNVSQNTLLEYVMACDGVFEALVLGVLGVPAARARHATDAVLLLTVLVQYRKYESANPYIVKLSILDDDRALNGYAQTLSAILSEFNRQYRLRNQEPEGGFFATLTNMVGNMFVAEEKKVDEAIKGNDSLLLALYEAVHLNRNFVTSLTHAHDHSTPTTPPSTPTSHSPTTEGPPPLDVSCVSEPTNLLVTFLEYGSIIMQDIKNPNRLNNVKLCLIILTCIAEDQYANSLMHDVNMNFRVPLHKMPMRHRKHAIVDRNPPSRPLVSSLLDLMVEFVMSHMMKNFPMELYLRCVGVVLRILCYQKRCRVRLQYPWKEMWTALINLLKFILANETHLLKKHNVFHLSAKVVNIFNLFITYGDTFLPNPSSYDELYYEVIRMHQVFDNLYSMALRYTTTAAGEWKESALRLTNALVNIRAIVNHFTPKVDAWASAHGLSALDEQQVLEVVRSNYDTLTLKLQESLDQYELYAEKPRETAFFTSLVRQIVCDMRTNAVSVPTTPPPS